MNDVTSALWQTTQSAPETKNRNGTTNERMLSVKSQVFNCLAKCIINTTMPIAIRAFAITNYDVAGWLYGGPDLHPSVRPYVCICVCLSVCMSTRISPCPPESEVRMVEEMYEKTKGRVRSGMSNEFQVNIGLIQDSAFHLSNEITQQEDTSSYDNRCPEEDYVRRRSGDRCRASGRIAYRTGREKLNV